jgi:hypothetical protein
MAFLNDLGKMLGETGKTAAGRVKDMSSAIQLRAKVSAEEDSRDKAYMAIGKKIFEQHTAVFEDEFASEFRTINEASERIRDLEARISELEGTRVCPECGARVARGAKYCSACGAPMEDFPKSESTAKDSGTGEDKDSAMSGEKAEEESSGREAAAGGAESPAEESRPEAAETAEAVPQSAADEEQPAAAETSPETDISTREDETEPAGGSEVTAE